MPAHLKTQPLRLETYRDYLAPRPSDTHKGDFGHVLIIGGDKGYAGAVQLAGEAALRTGAGAVTLATHPFHAATLTSMRPELMCQGLLDPNALSPLLQRASIIVIGPGLGQSEWGRTLLEATLAIQNKPLILDADALNLLPQLTYSPTPQHIYTPHPGEAARLLQLTPRQIQADRDNALRLLTEQYPGIVVLKGRHTLVGQAKMPAHHCLAGNPGMSSPGMGDVLTGVIAGLIAQHTPLFESVCLGVLIHALAGDRAALNGQRGLLASDLIHEIRHLVN